MFKVGDKVICIKKEIWKSVITGKLDNDGPKYGAILVVVGIIELGGLTYLMFSSWAPLSFNTTQFRKLSAISELASIKIIEETSDASIKDPSPKPLELEPA